MRFAFLTKKSPEPEQVAPVTQAQVPQDPRCDECREERAAMWLTGVVVVFLKYIDGEWPSGTNICRETRNFCCLACLRKWATHVGSVAFLDPEFP